MSVKGILMVMGLFFASAPAWAGTTRIGLGTKIWSGDAGVVDFEFLDTQFLNAVEVETTCTLSSVEVFVDGQALPVATEQEPGNLFLIDQGRGSDLSGARVVIGADSSPCKIKLHGVFIGY
jgi:hypothetical protein